MNALNALAAQFGARDLVGFLLTLTRIGPLFVLAPLFSSKQIPPRVRSVVAVALAIGLTPVAVHGVDVPGDPWLLAVLVVKELLVGAAYAFVIGLLLAAVSMAGSYVDTLIGFSFGSLVDPVTGNQSTVLAQLYSLVGVMVFVAIGGDAWVIEGLARTYDIVPMDAAPAIGTLTEGVQHAFVTLPVSAIEVCAPLLLAVILTDTAFGVVSRVMPQLNVFAVGFPAKVLIGLLLIGVSLPFVAGWISDELQRSVSTALHTLRAG